MQIVIPMAGFGERFRRAGFDRPKPLIEVHGRPMVAWVLDLFPGVPDPILLCNADHLDEPAWAMRDTLLGLRPGARVVAVPSHNLGPVHTLAEGLASLDLDQEVLVCVCDLNFDWSFKHFQTWVHASGADGAVVAYRGFHPHLLHSVHYAFLKERHGWATEIREKHAFTDDPIGNQEWCSNGVYWFKTARRMAEIIGRIRFDEGLAIAGEHYPSQLFQPMIDDGDAVAVYPTDAYCQWGNPRDLEEYNHHATAFEARVGGDLQPAPLRGTLLIPLAGLGERFARAGHVDPKPLIPVNGRPMVVSAAAELRACTRQVFVLRQDLRQRERLQADLTAAFPDCTQVVLDGPTDGQARTVWLGAVRAEADPELPLVVGTCDNGLRFDSVAHDAALRHADLLVWTMRGHPGAVRRPEMYGWVDADDQGRVRRVSVKRPLADPARDPAIVGAFSFRRASDFLRAADRLFARDARVNGELYMDTLLDDALALGLDVRVFDVGAYYGWGTPEDWQTYNYWQGYFHHWWGHPYRVDRDPDVPPHAVAELAARYSPVPPSLPVRR